MIVIDTDMIFENVSVGVSVLSQIVGNTCATVTEKNHFSLLDV